MPAAYSFGKGLRLRLLQNSWQGGLPLFPPHVWWRGLLGSLLEGRQVWMRRHLRKTPIHLQKSLDASLLGATNVIANGCFGSSRVAPFDGIDNRPMFQQGRLAALAARDRKSTRLNSSHIPLSR